MNNSDNNLGKYNYVANISSIAAQQIMASTRDILLTLGFVTHQVIKGFI